MGKDDWHVPRALWNSSERMEEKKKMRLEGVNEGEDMETSVDLIEDRMRNFGNNEEKFNVDISKFMLAVM